MQTLSIGGRLTLVKSVLGSMPIFNFAIFKAPMGVLRELEGIRSHFFNGHDSNSKKATWVNWKKVLLSKDRGGLGVSSLYAMNRGLLFKWIWRFFTQGNTLWARVIKAIHGADGRIGANSSVGISSCWTNITQEMNSLSKKGIDLMKYMHIKVRNEDTTVFWEDKWCEEGVLKDRFPRVYALESCKQITVAAKLSQPNLSFLFRRNPRGGCGLDQFQKVKDLVSLVSLAPISDRWIWELENTGDFSVASVRRMIDDKMLTMLDCKTRWIKFNISRRGISIDSILCANCDTGVETSRHLFFSCGIARDVVNLITRRWNVPDSNLNSYEEWLAWLENVRLPSKNKKMLEGVFYVMWWLLWWFRNKTIFEGKTPKKAMFFDDLVYEEDVVMTTTAPTQTSVRWTRDEEKLLCEIHDDFNKSTNDVSRTKNMITGKWNRMHPDCQKFHAIYKGITRKSGENDGDVLEAAKAEYSACNKGKKFAYEHGWRVLKKHPKWDAADHFDSEDHTEIFGPDARPRPPGKTRPAKKTKSETTESSAGSGSGSMKDVLNEELRQKIQAGKSAYEAKKVKEQSATELNELQFLTIDADSLPEPKKTIIKNKQAQIMAKYQLFP
ncbi:hypothetical protein Tco_0209117 [Tanacetum coccineum]